MKSKDKYDAVIICVHYVWQSDVTFVRWPTIQLLFMLHSWTLGVFWGSCLKDFTTFEHKSIVENVVCILLVYMF